MASQYVKDDSAWVQNSDVLDLATPANMCACSVANDVIDKGATFIPATQRPDGTWRKARRVRDGYVPQDEMPLYESKGKQWAKNRPTLPPGLHPDDVAKAQVVKNHGIITPSSPDSLFSSPSNSSVTNSSPSSGSASLQGLSKSAKKNAKRKEKKKEKKNQVQNDDDDDALLAESVKNVHISNENSKATVEKSNTTTSTTAGTETAKRVKNLRKKLREIEVLKEKIATGMLPSPDKDQLEKIKREAVIKSEIEELELNEN